MRPSAYLAIAPSSEKSEKSTWTVKGAESAEMMKESGFALVIGAGGFLAGHLIVQLLDKG